MRRGSIRRRLRALLVAPMRVLDSLEPQLAPWARQHQLADWALVVVASCIMTLSTVFRNQVSSAMFSGWEIWRAMIVGPMLMVGAVVAYYGEDGSGRSGKGGSTASCRA